MTGLPLEEALAWREAVAEALAPDIEVVSPMRAKYHLRPGSVIADAYRESVRGRDKALISRDRWDVSRADVLLVNLLGARSISIGTMVELGWADALRKPIVLVMEPAGNVHDHSFVREIATFRVSTLEEAIDLIHELVKRGGGL